MTTRGTTSAAWFWRRALALVAAYLLVLQAALAGGAMQRMHAPDDLALHVICLTGGVDAPADDGERRPAPFECCGAGCLTGVQSVVEPSSVVETAPVPDVRVFDSGPAAQAPPHQRSTAEGPGPRGPPARA